jgi:DNA polymerase/3'-5' exonuclease PolX
MNTLVRPKIPREEALAVSREVYDRLSPFCSRCKIVGSLRRHRKFVGDVEVLFVPKLEKVKTGLFGDDFTNVDTAEFRIEAMRTGGILEKRPNVKGITAWGEKNKLAIHVASGIAVDLFSTTEENWWVSLVIRTGGKRTNLALTMGANKRGLTLHAYGSGFTNLSTGEKIVCHSEEDIFRIAGVPYQEPQFRL